MVCIETKFARHLEHQLVLNVHEARDFFDTFASCVIHQSVHQDSSQAHDHGGQI